MKNIRFVSKPESGHVEIHAKLKATGKYALLGTCHPATVPLIKRDGVKAHTALIQLPA